MARTGILAPSNIITGMLVGGAGLVAWFGMTGSGPATHFLETGTMTSAGEAPAGTAEPVAMAPAQSLAGKLPTRLVAPSAGIDTAVTEVGLVRRDGVTSWETAWRSAGHHLNSARPGQPGNVVITGHVSVVDEGSTAVFATLDRLQPGDIVEVHAGDEVYRYAIRSLDIVSPAAVHVLRSNAQSRLTLITCTPDLEHRLVVTGELVKDL
jgi:sortase A